MRSLGDGPSITALTRRPRAHAQRLRQLSRAEQCFEAVVQDAQNGERKTRVET